MIRSMDKNKASGNMVRSVKWVFVERIIQVAVALIVNTFLARYLGAERFGDLQGSLSTVAIFASVALLCSAEVIAPLYSKDQKLHQQLFEKAFVLRIWLALISIAGCILFCLYTGQPLTLILAFLIAGIIFQEPFNVYGLFFQTEGRQDIFSRIRIAGVVTKLLIVIGLVAMGAQSQYFGTPYLVEALLVAALLAIRFHKVKHLLWKMPEPELIRQLISSGVVFGSGIIAMVVMQKLDRMTLQHYGMRAELGVYSAAVQIAENWFYFSVLVVQALAARHIYQKNEQESRNTILRLCQFLFLITLGVAVCGLFLSTPVMTFLYGQEFVASGRYLEKLLFVAIMVFLDGILTTKILKDQQGLHFSMKWILALCCSFTYVMITHFFSWPLDPTLIPTFGYGFAMMYSIIYFMVKK
ncbi:MAG TPA: hypothetical protein DD666_07685 [Advenella kashmirensis]|uniref:Polysaccharide biosynthesis protein n=1 Tax=Advenella kashmirensis TaxID=310575 RepID=A0A356LED7_9BURK|nr:hypothetical protein [Advenella kashmirensis]